MTAVADFRDPFAGDYVRMFEALPPFVPPGNDEREQREWVEATGRAMLGADDDEATVLAEPDHRSLPAGYTYFGQFVAHDLTFLTGGRGGTTPGGLRNRRTPRLDLDSVYGQGPHCEPIYYDRRRPAMFGIGGKSDPLLAERSPAPLDDDLPRRSSGLAIVPDPRNDENVMVGQIHLAFLKAHNRFVRELADASPATATGNPIALWNRARRAVEWHYQWAVVHDYLPRILDRPRQTWLAKALELHAALVRHGAGAFEVPALARLPAEFVLAVFRFGHALVRPGYALNQIVLRPRRLTPRTWRAPPDSHLTGFGPLARHWTIDWRFFFDVDVPGGAALPAGLRVRLPQPARRIDGTVTGQLGRLPDVVGGGALPVLTIAAGVRNRLPGGVAVARALQRLDKSIALTASAAERPLWCYVLDEAREHGGGYTLGPVASTITARVFFDILTGMPDSYINVDPDWKPELGPHGRPFTIADLLLHGWPAPAA